MLCESYGFALGHHASGFSEDSGRISSNTRQVIVRPGKWQLLRLRNPRRPQGKNIQPSDLVRASLVAYTAPGLAWQHPLTQTSSFKDSGLTAPPRLGRTGYIPGYLKLAAWACLGAVSGSLGSSAGWRPVLARIRLAQLVLKISTASCSGRSTGRFQWQLSPLVLAPLRSGCPAVLPLRMTGAV